jgi:hypothetical protein
MLSIELAEGFTAPASLAASQLRSHSLQVRAAAAADSSQYLVDYMVRAQDEKLKAIESTKAAVAQEYEARLAAMEARLQQLSAGTQPKAAAVAAPAAPAAAVAAAPAAPVKSASQAVGYAPAGPDKRIEDYRAEMAEFLLTVQRERLQSMDTLRRELSTAYDEQVADVQAQIAQLNAPVASAAPVAAAKPVAAAAVTAPKTHPAYAARQQRQGWTDRWGDSETARLGVPQAAVAVTAPPAAAAAAKPTTAATAAPQVHPAYTARQQRQGWSDRWGESETARLGVSQAIAPAVSAVAAAVAPQKQQQSNVHPAYAARLTRQGWQDRWGASETLRITAEAITSVDSSSTTTATAALPANVHPAYAARLQREDWSGRWGAEESLRVSAVADRSTAAATAATATDSSGDVAEVTRQLEELRSYLQLYITRSGEERSKLTGRLDAANSRAEAAAEQLNAVRASYEAYAASSLEHRTAAVAAAREAALREAAASTSSSEVNGSNSSSGGGSGAAAPVAAVQPAAAVAAVAAVPLNAAYVARNTRPGLSSRWGAEELQRVAASSK